MKNTLIGENFAELDLTLRDMRKEKQGLRLGELTPQFRSYFKDLGESLILISALIGKLTENDQKEIMDSYGQYWTEFKE